MRSARTALDDTLVADAYRRDWDEGLSLRALARAMLEQTPHQSAHSLANALHLQFRRRGWPLRDRVSTSRTASTTHGRARDPAHRVIQRRARGEVADVACAGVIVAGPRAGTPCARPAQSGRAFCIAHDPERAEERAARLADARERRAGARVSTSGCGGSEPDVRPVARG